MCFPAPDSVPVRDRDHEGRLSGRRENQTQPHVDVHQRKTRQEEHHDLNARHCVRLRHGAQKPYVMWLSCVHSVFISILQFFLFFTVHNVHVSVEGSDSGVFGIFSR